MALVAVGPNYFVAGFNNRLSFYRGGWPTPISLWSPVKETSSVRSGENICQNVVFWVLNSTDIY